MAASIFKAISNLRFALSTETDADSPDNETTYGAIREAIEYLFKILFSDGFTGTASANPPDDNTGVLTHAGAAQVVDEHNGRTLIITSGNAVGNFYTIDDSAAQTLTCTGDNLYSDGVRSGDDFEILYDIKANADGHDHDGVNSKAATSQLAGSHVVTKADDDTEYDESFPADAGNEWVTKATYKIYVPAIATTMSMSCRAKKVSATTEAGKIRFSVDGNTSTETTTDQSEAYAWYEDSSLDVSALSGWLELDIDIWTEAAGGCQCWLQGYTVIFD